MKKRGERGDSSSSRAVPVGRHAFVVRIWQEEGGAGWRGWVQHAGTGSAIYVQSLDELLAFIEHRTGDLTDSGRGRSKRLR